VTERANPQSGFKVTWFPPDRPVEGNTIYVRPAGDADQDADEQQEHGMEIGIRDEEGS